MTCDQAIRLVEKLADGEAKPSERTEAESHLESCEDCRSHYQFVRALESASEKIHWPELTEAYWQHLPSKVLARLEREGPARSFWQNLLSPPVLRFGAVAATLTVVVAVGFNVLRNDQLQREPDAAQAPARTGKRQVDEKVTGVSGQPAPAAGVSPQPALETEPLAAAPSFSVDTDSVAPEESGRVESARRSTLRRAESLEPRPAPPLVLPKTPPAEPAQLVETEEDELADLERPAGSFAAQSFQDAPAAAPPRRREDRMLRSFADSPGEPVELTVVSEEATNAELAPVALGRKQAPARALSSVTNRCGEWRDYLAENGDEGSDSLEARYQVALCSLERYASEPSDDARATVERDVEAFLAMESDGERADEVRARAQQLRR